MRILLLCIQYCSVKTTNSEGIIFGSIKINYDEDEGI